MNVALRMADISQLRKYPGDTTLFTGQLPPGSGRTFAREYRETLDLVRLAEALGFDSAWVSEHHGSSDGYLPSLLPMLGDVGGGGAAKGLACSADDPSVL